MTILRLMVAVWLFVSLSATAQVTAHYSVEFHDASKSTPLPSETWKVSRVEIEGTRAFELDKGNEDIELHDLWGAVSENDKETHLVERFWAHPVQAMKDNLQSFTGFVQKVNLDGEVLQSWPAFHSFSTLPNITLLVSTYFPPDNRKIVWKRLYLGETYLSYLLPFALTKELYEKASDEYPTEVFIYKQTSVEH